MRIKKIIIIISIIIKLKKLKASEEEILNRYIITNSINFIKIENGKYVLTNNKNEATVWKEEKSARNIIKSNLNNSEITNKTSYYTQKIDKQNDINKNNQKGKYMIDYIEENSEKQEKIYDKNNLLEDNLDNILELVSSLPNKLKNQKTKIESQLIKCCRILTDTMHYKEFNTKRSASERCKLDIFEQKVILKRRELKDDILKIETIENNLKGGDKSLNLENRKYEPRELNDLFETNTIPNFKEWWEEKYERI